MSELKPCPKCMSSVLPWVLEHRDRDGTSNGWYVECEGCSLTCGRLYTAEQEAVDGWNDRPKCEDCKASTKHTMKERIWCHTLEISNRTDFYCAKFERSKA